jgi:hypothetical protein
MRIDINTDGSIAAIGFMPYEYPCPEFITFSNFQQYRCINIDDIMNEANWEFAER